MSRWMANTLGGSLILAILLAIWGGFGLTRHGIEMMDAAKASAPGPTKPTVDALTNLETDLLRRCKPIKGELLTVDNAKDCGLLPQLTIFLNTARGTVGQIEVALRKESRAADDLHETQAALQGTLNGIAGTANAGTGLAHELTRTVQTVNDPKTGVGPLLGHLNEFTVGAADATTSINGFLKGKMLTETLPATAENFQGMTGHGNAILGNVETVSTKAKDDYMKAHTPWGRIVNTGLDLLDIGGATARHY